MERIEASSTKKIVSKRISRLAVFSFVIGLTSVLAQLLLFVSLLNFDYPFRMEVVLYVRPILFLIMIPTALSALFAGIITLVRLRLSRDVKGKGYAITGIIYGSELVLLTIIVIAFWTPLYE